MKKIKFYWLVILTLVLAIGIGWFFGSRQVVKLYQWESPDMDIKGYFTNDPIESYQTFLEDYASATMFSAVSRHPRGLDEIDRLEVKKSEAGQLLFKDMSKPANIKVVRDDINDFLLEITDDKSTETLESGFIRGRIFFQPTGKYLYRVWIIRDSIEETEMPSAKKIIFGAELNIKED